MESKMDNNTQTLSTDAQSWDAFYDRMINNSVVTAAVKNPGLKSYSISKFTPNIEIVVIDPNDLCESKDSGCESDGDINSNIEQPEPSQKHEVQTLKQNQVQNIGNELAQPQSKASEPLPKREVHTLKSNQVQSIGNELAQPPSKTSASEEPVKLVDPDDEPVDPIEPVELIDGLFDFVTLNVEDEDVLLQDMKSYENISNNFDLAAYITDQSESPINSPETVDPTEDCKTHHPEVHQATKPVESKIITDNNRRNKLKRQFLGEDSDSEDDCKKLKKRKIDNDPLWMPSEKPKSTVIDNKKLQSNNGIRAVNGIRYGIGSGKNFATLCKYFRRSTSSENSNCDNATFKSVNRRSSNEKSTVNVDKVNGQICTKIDNHSIAQKDRRDSTKAKDSEINNNATDSLDFAKVNRSSPKEKTMVNVTEVKKDKKMENISSDIKIHKNIVNNSSAQKSRSDNKKSKDSAINNTADLSDFERAILTSMAVPKIKPKPKRNNSTAHTRKIQFQEHSVKFRQYLSDIAAKSKVLQENLRRPPVVSCVPKPADTGNRESEQDRKTDIENCSSVKKDEEPKGTRKISVQEYLQRKHVNQSPTSDIESNVKRKITVAEYFKRKTMMQPA